MNRRILVTGATGFIGRATVPALVDRGFEVVALTRTPESFRVPGVEYVHCDLSDDAAVVSVMRNAGASHLLHLAWRQVVGGLWSAPENLDWLRISLRLAEHFVAAGGKRVTVSGTCGEYDWRGGLCREGMTPLAPTTYYGACKLALYHALKGYCDSNNVEMAWGRVFFVYGPGEHESRLGASIIQSILEGEPALCSHGMQLRDYMHVGDVGAGLAALADSELVGEFNIATGQAVRVMDLIMALANALGRPELVRLGAREAPAFEPPLIVADMTKTFDSDLGFRPQFSLEAGAIDTVDWFRR